MEIYANDLTEFNDPLNLIQKIEILNSDNYFKCERCWNVLSVCVVCLILTWYELQCYQHGASSRLTLCIWWMLNCLVLICFVMHVKNVVNGCVELWKDYKYANVNVEGHMALIWPTNTGVEVMIDLLCTNVIWMKEIE